MSRGELEALLTSGGFPPPAQIDPGCAEEAARCEGRNALRAPLALRGWLSTFDLEGDFFLDGEHAAEVKRWLARAKVAVEGLDDRWLKKAGRVLSVIAGGKTTHLGVAGAGRDGVSDWGELELMVAAAQWATDAAAAGLQWWILGSRDQVAWVCAVPTSLTAVLKPVLKPRRLQQTIVRVDLVAAAMPDRDERLQQVLAVFARPDDAARARECTAGLEALLGDDAPSRKIVRVAAMDPVGAVAAWGLAVALRVYGVKAANGRELLRLLPVPE